MTDFKIYGKCFMCRLNRFFVRKRKITLKHISKHVTSREMFCTPCFKDVLQAQKKGILN